MPWNLKEIMSHYSEFKLICQVNIFKLICLNPLSQLNKNKIKQKNQKKYKETTFIVSLFISVQIPSNFVCTHDIYIKIQNYIFITEFCISFVMLKNKRKMHFEKTKNQ